MAFRPFQDYIGTFVQTFKHLSRDNVDNGVEVIILNILTVDSHLDTHFINHR